jgi:hypothetical protein
MPNGRARRCGLTCSDRSGTARPAPRGGPLLISACARDGGPLAVSLCVPAELAGPPESVPGVLPGTGVTLGYMNWCVIWSLWRRPSRISERSVLDRRNLFSRPHLRPGSDSYVSTRDGANSRVLLLAPRHSWRVRRQGQAVGTGPDQAPAAPMTIVPAAPARTTPVTAGGPGRTVMGRLRPPSRLRTRSASPSSSSCAIRTAPAA